MPIVPQGFKWHIAFESNGISTEPGEELPLRGERITLGARTTAVLIAKTKGRG